MGLMRTIKPVHARKLAALAKQHQTNAMARINVARVGGPDHRMAAVNPNLYHAARQMASGQPGKYPSHEVYNDALHSAHKAMANATAFSKAAKGLAHPMNKRTRKMGPAGARQRSADFRSAPMSATQSTPLRGGYR